MKKDIFIFFAVIVILGVAFTTYLDWLLIQPKPVVAQLKMSPPSSHVQSKPDMR